MACSEPSAPHLVVFKAGFVADWSLVTRLLDVEQRGATFELVDDGGFRVIPPTVLTTEDIALFRARRDEARQVIAYSQLMCQRPL